MVSDMLRISKSDHIKNPDPTIFSKPDPDLTLSILKTGSGSATLGGHRGQKTQSSGVVSGPSDEIT